MTEQILNLFPTERSVIAVEQGVRHAEPEPERSTIGDRLCYLHSQIELYPASKKDQKIERPGDQYLCHSSTTVLPIGHQTLLQAAADLLAITRDDLGKVVRNFENQFQNHLKEQKRRGMRESKMDVDREQS